VWAHDLKLARAREHFNELQSEVRRWEEGEGYALRVNEDGHSPFYIARAEILKPVEEHPYSLLVGDFLQNARAALDYIASALGDVGAGGVMSERDAAETMFPIVGDVDPWWVSGDSPGVFAERAKRRLPTVPDAARAVIEDLQPYKKGGDLWAYEPLWVLNELARFDRHRFLQLGVARAGGFGLNPDTSRNVTVTHMLLEEGSLSLLEGIAAEEAVEDRAMGLDPHEDTVRIASFCAEPTDPNAEMHMDFEGALEIVFDDDMLPESVRLGDEAIVTVLLLIALEIDDVFRALRPFLPVEPPEW
jgi:hypothetical protein